MDSRLAVQGTKIGKISEGTDISGIEDRISNLPDAVLCHILSFLPTKTVVQTSPLAKRWKYLWVSVPNIDLDLYLPKNYMGNREDIESFLEVYMNSFMTFIERYFVLRENLCIKKFRLSSYFKIDFSRFYSWVCAVITCNVRELHLALATYEIGELPWSLFTCKTLVVLKIDGEFIFNVPHYVCLPNLKTLRLNSLIYLDDELIQKFLSSCPALEDLEIRRPGWDNLWTLDISVPSLKRLTLVLSIHELELYYEAGFKYKIMVNAPNLEYLDFCDTVSDYISVGGLPSVVEARVDIHKSFKAWNQGEQTKYGDRASGLLRSISNVGHLSLTGNTLRCLSYCAPNLATYRNLVHLELGFDPFNGPLLLLDLLQSSPKLEILVFPEGLTVPDDREYDINRRLGFEYHWSPPERVPECLLLSLKTIEIHRFFGDVKDELNLVKYLLKNGMVLEKMTILCSYYDFVGDNSFSFKDELENYPRGSNNCNLRLCVPYPGATPENAPRGSKKFPKRAKIQVSRNHIATWSPRRAVSDTIRSPDKEDHLLWAVSDTIRSPDKEDHLLSFKPLDTQDDYGQLGQCRNTPFGS
ncbi:hypothetical protein Vadar_002040 [Vaccinium darrowii]|uniref:Uncharacterized protein n=1 Tax=Vaccinium darrowii TaxID=229202 RepID=A0ACB7Z0X9_9ERIC|nr:hypothetical protein Vadar_002040 [Vaccinium darrowii]